MDIVAVRVEDGITAVEDLGFVIRKKALYLMPGTAMVSHLRSGRREASYLHWRGPAGKPTA